MDYKNDWEKLDMDAIIAQIKRERMQKKAKDREWFDSLFPELKGVPFGWIIFAGICVLFNLLTLFII